MLMPFVVAIMNRKRSGLGTSALFLGILTEADKYSCYSFSMSIELQILQSLFNDKNKSLTCLNNTFLHFNTR